MAVPGSGLIKNRNHTAGEKIHCEAFGWVRDVLDLKGHSTALFSAVGAHRQLDLAQLVAGVP